MKNPGILKCEYPTNNRKNGIINPVDNANTATFPARKLIEPLSWKYKSVIAMQLTTRAIVFTIFKP